MQYIDIDLNDLEVSVDADPSVPVDFDETLLEAVQDAVLTAVHDVLADGFAADVGVRVRQPVRPTVRLVAEVRHLPF